MGFLVYVTESLLVPYFVGHFISEGLMKKNEKKQINEMKEKIASFNSRFDDTEVDSNYFVEYLSQSEVITSIINRVFHAYKSSNDSYDIVIKNIANEAIDYVNTKKTEFGHPLVKREDVFKDYFSSLFGLLIAQRESLLSVKDKAIVSLIVESISEREANDLNTMTCEDLNNWYIANTINECTLELFNHENKEFANDLLSQLSRNTINIRGENVFETVAYIAYLFLNDVRFDEYKDKVRIVEDESSWNNLKKYKFTDYVFINRFINTNQLELVEKNKCVLVYGKNDYTKSKDFIELDKRFFRNLIDKVTQSGFEHQKAYDLSVASRNNYTILMKQLFLGKQKLSSWANLEFYRSLLPIMIINQWLDKDAVIFELLFDHKKSYVNYIEELKVLNNDQDPFFVVHMTRFNHKKYLVTDPEAAWDFFGGLIDNSLFEKLEPMIDLVLGEIDPKFELPSDQHYYANILGYAPQFSDELKNGFVETLIYLSKSELGISYSIKKKIKDLLAKVNTKKEWFAISELLPSIFEINPDALLSKFEVELDNNDSGLVNLFIEKSDDFFSGRNYYTHVIWALEKALYSEDHVFRAIIILSRLMDYDIEYKISNSPLITLYNALVAWSHEYIYSIAEKINYVRYIVEHSSKGWLLIEKLLPSYNSSIISNLSKSKYSNYLLSDELKSREQVYDTFTKYYEIALDNVGENVTNLCVFYENAIFFNFGIYNKLKTITCELVGKFTDLEKYELYKKVYKLIANNRHFQNSEWAGSQENLTKIEFEILNSIVFKDESFKYQYVFESYSDILLNPVVYTSDNSHSSMNENQKLEDELRSNSIKKLIELNVVWKDFFKRLSIESSSIIGKYLAQEKRDLVFIEELSEMLVKESRISILSAYYGSLFLLLGLDIVELFVSSKVLNQKQYLEKILNFVDIDNRTLIYLDSLSKEYQEVFWGISRNAYHVNEEAKDSALDNYVKYKNSSALVELADHYVYSTNKLIEVLEVIKENPILYNQMTSYHIERIFKKIYEDDFPQTPISQHVLNLEMYFFPIIGDKRALKYLVYNLSVDPNFSAELIRYVYKSEILSDEKVDDENTKRFAEIAHSILISIKFSPSNNGVGLMDYQSLKNWCDQYILTVSKNNQKKIGMNYLGRFLANTNMVNPEEFPQEPVMKVIETVFDEELLRGFNTEVFNSLGVRTVSDGSGYLALSRTYAKFAENSKMYTKSYRILSSISKSFFKEYESEKESAKYDN